MGLSAEDERTLRRWLLRAFRQGLGVRTGLVLAWSIKSKDALSYDPVSWGRRELDWYPALVEGCLELGLPTEVWQIPSTDEAPALHSRVCNGARWLAMRWLKSPAVTTDEFVQADLGLGRAG